MNVLGIGETVVDKISVIKDSDCPDVVLGTQHDAGGPVLSALILLSRLGADCIIVTSLGNDQEGALIRRTLVREGISLIECKQSATKTHSILVDAKTGQRQKLRGTVEHTPLENLDPQLIRKSDLIVMDRHEHSAFYEVVKHLDDNARLITDPSTEVSPFTLDMMRHSACAIVPIESLATIGKNSTLDAALDTLFEICGKPFVVTLGELGSLIHDGNSTQLVAPLEVRAVDTNGAGDVFRGAFAHGWTRGWGINNCVRYANVVAALQCTRRGNATAVPDQNSIEAYLANASWGPVDISDVEARFATLT